MKVDIPKEFSSDGPVVLICDDNGSKLDGKRIHVALFFPNRKKAEKHRERLILGKDGKTDIYPIELV